MSTIQPKSVSYFWSCPDVVHKIYAKKFAVSCTNTHHDLIDLGNHEMVQNAKTWLSWEQKITFLGNKKTLTCASFYISENIFFQEHLVALRIHICIFVEIIFLPEGKGASLSLVGHPSSDGITKKIWGRCFVMLATLAAHLFLEDWLKLNLNFWIKWDWLTGRWALVVAVIDVDAYCFLVFSDLTSHPKDAEIWVCWLHCGAWQ